ncbi:MAG TPA: NAD-dependent epimerase/dehydratase family protein [Deltaproteobacteria bacterium]|nr:NAD-dependent epimerase/dehydratase family protein [Deltaproteobacteria bacterium]
MASVLVTGGGGFLGRRVVELLLQQGHQVRFLARSRYPEVEALGAEGRIVDLCDATAVEAACEGIEIVHHVASKAGYWGERAEFEAINVEGTQHVIEACRAQGIRSLIYTSTPSVIGYEHDAEGIESAPYPGQWESLYGETKARAEQAVLEANGAAIGGGGALATVSLRPHLIIGPRDNNLLPRVIQRARDGKLAIVGDGGNLVDLTYVDNAAWAHLDAQAALTGPDAACAGKAYFISNDEPVRLWDWLNDLLPRVGAPRVDRKVPLKAASAMGGALEWTWRTLRMRGEPRMTRFLAAALARSHWYSMEPAKRELGYKVRISLEEGTRRTVSWLNGEPLGEPVTVVALLEAVEGELSMATLEQIATACGHTDVRTYRSEGNVIFSTDRPDLDAVARALEASLAEAGVQTRIAIRTRDQLAAVVSNNPLLSGERDAADLHVAFLDETTEAEPIAELQRLGTDELVRSDRELYLHLPTGADGALSQRGVPGAVRSWPTITKLLQLADAPP